MPICTQNFYHWHFKIYRLLKKNLASCSPFVYFGTILFSENENKASKHTPAPCCILVLVWEHNAAMFGSRTAANSVCSENLPPWKLLKLPDIPALWGVCPPATRLVFPQSPAQGTQSSLQGGQCPHDQVVSKMLKVLLPDRRSSLLRCWFFICALFWLLWVQLLTTPPTSATSLVSLHG